MSGGRQPDLDEIEAWFAAVAEGRVSRDAADRWAARRYLDDSHRDDGRGAGDLARWALGLLHGIDLRSGPGEPYLHDDAQVRGWLEELRRRRAA
ncbi:hypothetical protein [Streptomyces sp. CC228A]|uniref:hypothetical protein n=1 Tax=Streptomyces sp. CC228A TaxID=2898186 RepID=UPI001F308BE8|nr:hypothetical protein [Streptomyces sp. CC228A]